MSKTKLLMTSNRLRRALIKASITWDYPCYLYTYKYTYISYACFHLVDLSKIIDDCYLDSLLPTTSIPNCKSFDFFYPKFDHSSYSKKLCKYSQILSHY